MGGGGRGGMGGNGSRRFAPRPVLLTAVKPFSFSVPGDVFTHFMEIDIVYLAIGVAARYDVCRNIDGLTACCITCLVS